jgi:2',3'-cyclic-nucleotide 2'-phosphodiesterase / 3'-nucleotidase / 5'-nucleotidase
MLARLSPRCLLLALLGACSSASRKSGGGEVELVIAATTDVHGRLRGWDYYAGRPDSLRGLSRVATIVDSLRAADSGRVVLVDAGDLLQGNPLTYVAARVETWSPHPVIAAMNALGYDAAAIGNHEFNYGVPTLERSLAGARFPFLAANAFRLDGTRAFPAFRIVERRGIKIGIVGATTPGAMIWDAENLSGRLVIRDIVPAVRDAVREARDAGAEVIVVTVHSGLAEPSNYDTVTTGVASENVAARLAREVPGIDLVVFGHSHAELADSTIGTTLLVQPKNWATSVAVARLGVVRQGGHWRVARRRGIAIPAAGHAESPRVLAVTEAAHRATVAYVTTPIGTTPVAWRGDSARVVDTPIVDFILEVERKAAGAELASTAAFDLSASFGPGPITVADVARLYPYENGLRAVRITGRQLRDYLEHTSRYYRGSDAAGPVVDPAGRGYNFDILAGADYTLDISRPAGSRVTRLTVKGRPVADADTFTLALNDYRQRGGGEYTMLRGAPVVYDKQLEIRQLLIDEVKARGTIVPADYFMRNWELLPVEAHGRAYQEMHEVERRLSGSPLAPRSPPVASRVSPLVRRLRIIATNDFHGFLEARPDSSGVTLGGAAHLATAIGRLREACAAPACVSILLDGGDMFQGTPASNFSYGRSVVAFYNMLGYAAAAFGNHELDWGPDTLRARMREAHFPILAANLRRTDGGDLAWVPDDTLLVRDGLRIGVVGVLTTDMPNLSRPTHFAGMQMVDPAPVVSERARALRARGADVVIVVAHAGARCAADGSGCHGEIVTMAEHLTERVDAIVSGHSHTFVHTVANGVPIIQTSTRGRAVGTIDLDLAAGGAAPRIGLYTIDADSIPADPRVDSLVHRAIAEVGPRIDEVVARLDAPLLRTGPQYPLGNLIADAVRAGGQGDVGIINTGAIRIPLNAGPLTYETLYELHPFGNVLYRYTLRGRVLREYLERIVGRSRLNAHISGVRVVYDPAKPAGGRIVRVTLADGRPLVDAATYRLVSNDFLAAGGDGLGLAGLDAIGEPLGTPVLDALVAYVHALPQPIRAPAEVRLAPVPSTPIP